MYRKVKSLLKLKKTACLNLHNYLTTSANDDLIYIRNIPIINQKVITDSRDLNEITSNKLKELTGYEVGHSFGILRYPFKPITDSYTINSILNYIDDDTVKTNRAINNYLHMPFIDIYEKYVNDKFFLTYCGITLFDYLESKHIKITNISKKFKRYANKYRDKIQGNHQSTNSILLVSPKAFSYNEETAEDNKFMNNKFSSTNKKLLKKYEYFYRLLIKAAQADVTLFEHGVEHGTPDAVFPNNWFSTHSDPEYPCLVLYPLKCINRRLERRIDIIDYLKRLKMSYENVLDLTEYENENMYLEGTGSLVLDRENKIAYASISERTSEKLAELWVEKMGYNDLIKFKSFDTNGQIVYHTNVMMSIGNKLSVICLDAISDEQERKKVKDSLEKYRKVLSITKTQMSSMCGNVLELLNNRGLPIIVMSHKAFSEFSVEQKDLINRCTHRIIHPPVSILEEIGGGSVRCAIAELF